MIFPSIARANGEYDRMLSRDFRRIREVSARVISFSAKSWFCSKAPEDVIACISNGLDALPSTGENGLGESKVSFLMTAGSSICLGETLRLFDANPPVPFIFLLVF